MLTFVRMTGEGGLNGANRLTARHLRPGTLCYGTSAKIIR